MLIALVEASESNYRSNYSGPATITQFICGTPGRPQQGYWIPSLFIPQKIFGLDDVVRLRTCRSEYETERKVLMPKYDANIDSVLPKKLLFSVTEVAGLLGYSRQVVYEFIKRGELLTVTPTAGGRGMKIPRSEILRFVEVQTAKARHDLAKGWS